MKTCPVCNAVAFDDQATCYGCLHDFEKGSSPGETSTASDPAPNLPGAASFLLSLAPHPEASGSFSWTCTVEPVTDSK